MNILILFASLEGQTAKISNRIAQLLAKKGHGVTSRTAEKLPDDFDLGAFEAVIIGGSIHMGHYPKYLLTFVKQHHDWLNSIPSAFFTVCMGINSQQAEARQEAAGYSETFIAQTDWKPTHIATFAGAVKYTQYNFITRFIMKKISQKEGGSTDTSKDHEYTNWEAVERFADEFAKNLATLQYS